MIESTNFPDTDKDNAFDRNFKRRGVITFFVQLILLVMVIWYGVFFLTHVRI